MGGCFFDLVGFECCVFFFGVKFAKDQRLGGGGEELFFIWNIQQPGVYWITEKWRGVGILFAEVGFQDAGSQWGTASSGA